MLATFDPPAVSDGRDANRKMTQDDEGEQHHLRMTSMAYDTRH